MPVNRQPKEAYTDAFVMHGRAVCYMPADEDELCNDVSTLAR